MAEPEVGLAGHHAALLEDYMRLSSADLCLGYLYKYNINCLYAPKTKS